MRDDNDGHGGTYEVKDGKRVLVKGSRTEPTDTGGAREANGKPIEEPRDHLNAPALPAPGKAPWETPAQEPAPEPAPPAGARGPRKLTSIDS